MMKRLILLILLFACAVWVYGQEQDTVAQEPVQGVSEQVSDNLQEQVQEAAGQESAIVSETEQEDVLNLASTPQEPKPETPSQENEAPQDSSKDVVVQDSAQKQQSGGLLDELYPVSPDEAISAGHILGGATLSLIQANTEDDALNVIIGDVYEADGYMFTVQAFGGYFIKDALAVGAHFGYSRTWLDVDFSLLEDIADVKQRRKYMSNGFFVQPFLKNYLKVMDSKSLYFFNETSVLVQYSYGMSQTDDGEEMDKTRNKTWTIKAGLNPGICIMVLSRFAFETSVGLLGLSTSVVDVEENGESHSRLVYNIVNFTINLLALDFSLVYFF